MLKTKSDTLITVSLRGIIYHFMTCSPLVIIYSNQRFLFFYSFFRSRCDSVPSLKPIDLLKNANKHTQA